MTESWSDNPEEAVSDEMWERLYERAAAARRNAWSPYSDFQVGAALVTPGGDIYDGCNVENATFGATVCAERTAVGCAVKEGEREFEALVVITDLDDPASPCGICRQVLAEFCDDLPIMLANLDGERRFTTLDILLPQRFSGRDI